MFSSITFISVLEYTDMSIFDFAMSNLFALAILNPEKIFNHFSYFNLHVNFNCLLGRCGDQLLIVCY